MRDQIFVVRLDQKFQLSSQMLQLIELQLMLIDQSFETLYFLKWKSNILFHWFNTQMISFSVFLLYVLSGVLHDYSSLFDHADPIREFLGLV